MKTPGLKTRFNDEKRHSTKNEDKKVKENSTRESSKFRSDKEQENHVNKP